MPDIEQMNADEQKAWWSQQATTALTRMNIAHASVDWLAYTHNAVFKVMRDAETYILRLQKPRTKARLLGEAKMLSTLYEEGLAVPEPLQTYISDDAVGLLLSYLAGTNRKPDTITADDMQAIGRFLARLHAVPLRFDGSDDLPHLDWQGLFGKGDLYDPGDDNAQIFTQGQLEAMGAVAQTVRYAMNEIAQDGGGFGLIHGDFLLHNILFHEGQVRALDFEYCGWGYYLYDLSPVLWQLKPQPHYTDLETALLEGYSAIRGLSQRHLDLLETFIAGRQVASMRWVAANQHNPAYADTAPKLLDQRTAELEGFLKTGLLNRS